MFVTAPPTNNLQLAKLHGINSEILYQFYCQNYVFLGYPVNHDKNYTPSPLPRVHKARSVNLYLFIDGVNVAGTWNQTGSLT